MLGATGTLEIWTARLGCWRSLVQRISTPTFISGGRRTSSAKTMAQTNSRRPTLDMAMPLRMLMAAHAGKRCSATQGRGFRQPRLLGKPSALPGSSNLVQRGDVHPLSNQPRPRHPNSERWPAMLLRPAILTARHAKYTKRNRSRVSTKPENSLYYYRRKSSREAKIFLSAAVPAAANSD